MCRVGTVGPVTAFCNDASTVDDWSAGQRTYEYDLNMNLSFETRRPSRIRRHKLELGHIDKLRMLRIRVQYWGARLELYRMPTSLAI